MTSIAVVILNWNGIDDTISCVDVLKRQTFNDFHIVLVDNGSVDNSVEKLDTVQSEKITLLKNKHNLGFAGGVNTGIRWAKQQGFSHVVLLNNDTKPKEDWLEKLIVSSKHNESGITTSLLLHEDGKTIDSTGDYYSIWGIPSPRLRGKPFSLAPESGYVFGASGGASLYSMELFDNIGLFDENFFAYYEDVDISFRAQLAGYKVYYEKLAVVYHKQGATSSKIPGFTTYQAFKNIPQLYFKNVPFSLLLPIGVHFFPLYWLMILNAIRQGRGIPALKGVAMSVWFFWTANIWQRKSIQSRKKVSTHYIRSIVSKELPPDSSLRKIRWFK